MQIENGRMRDWGAWEALCLTRDGKQAIFWPADYCPCCAGTYPALVRLVTPGQHGENGHTEYISAATGEQVVFGECPVVAAAREKRRWRDELAEPREKYMWDD